MTKLNEIVFDLERFRMLLSFIEGFKGITTQLAISFEPSRKNTPSRPFYFSFIAFLVHRMKSENRVLSFNVSENAPEKDLKDVSFLDKKICGKECSKSYKKLRGKIVRWWPERIKSLAKAESFKILDGLSKKRRLEVYEGTKKQYIWYHLFQKSEKYEVTHIKFAIDDPEVEITLDQIKFIYKGINNDDALAWKEFIKDLATNAYADSLPQEGDKNIDEVLSFLKKIEDSFKCTKIFHNQLNIDKHYIHINVMHERKPKYDVSSISDQLETTEDINRAYSFKGFDENDQESKPWKEVKGNYDRLIVLADPGMGKSTLLHLEALKLAREQSNNLKISNNIDDVIFPIYADLEYLSAKDEPIVVAILQRLKDKFSISDYLEEMIKAKSIDGKCVFLLDTLDNVQIEKTKQLWDRLDTFVTNNTCRIIITSRITGYGGCPLSSFKEVEINPFSKHQINQFVYRWFDNYNSNNLVSPDTLLAELSDKPQIYGIAQIPLLLQLLCYIHTSNNEGSPPARKVDVYKEALNCLLVLRPENRKPQTVDRINAKTELLEKVAYRLSCENLRAFKFRDLTKLLTELNKQNKIPQDLLGTPPGKLIRELSEDDGILICLEKHKSLNNNFIFFHHTFQEFFTACFVKDTIENNHEEGLQIIKDHLWDFQWREILCMTAGLLTKPEALINQILSEKDDIFSSLIVLSGKCLVEIETFQHLRWNHIIDELFELCRLDYHLDEVESVIISLCRVNSYAMRRLTNSFNDHKLGPEWTIDLMSRVGTSNSFTFLFNLLTHERPIIRALSAKCLRTFNTNYTVNKIIDFIKSSQDESTKYILLYTLGEMRNEYALDTLLEALNEKFYLTVASQALAKIGNKKVATYLINKLQHSDSFDTIIIIDALMKLDDKKETRKLLSKLIHTIQNENSSEDKITALEKLTCFSDFRQELLIIINKTKLLQAARVTENMLSSPNLYLRIAAANALGVFGDIQSSKKLVCILKDKDDNVKEAAIKSLGTIGLKQAIKPLKNCFDNNSNYLKIKIINAICKIEWEQARELLVSGLYDLNDDYKAHCIRIIGYYGDSSYGKHLIKCFKKGNIDIKILTTKIIGEIKYYDFEDYLLTLLSKKVGNYHEDRLLVEVAATLIKIGSTKTLMKLISDPEIDIYYPPFYQLLRNLSLKYKKEAPHQFPIYPELIERLRPSNKS